ncbi:MAG: FtsX-like permease family protein [Pseudohongiellaceae bacterium]
MFKNYLRITLRKLYREKLYALINVFGLTLGISCCLILGLYIVGELSYDRHHVNHERIFRVVNNYNFSGNENALAWSAQSLGQLLLMDNPDAVETYTRFRPPNAGQPTVFRRGQDTYYWDDVYLADLNVFDVFTHNIIYGNPEGALNDGNSVAVSETFARSYFGDANPVGEIVSTDTADYRITLMFADLPEHSHLKYDVLISINRTGVLPENEAVLQQMLGGVSDFTYLLMRENFNPADFDRMFSRFTTDRIESMARTFGLQDSFDASFRAQALTDVHLESGLQYDLPSGSRFYVVSFAAVALFILGIACINYVNLATARSMKRAREVGMRKVLGAQRNQLIWQFLGESLFFVLLAVLTSLALVQLLLNYSLLDELLGANFYSGSLFDPVLLVWLIGLSLLVGLLSGLYPAFYLSSVAPMVALSSAVNTSRSASGRLRQFLVFIQFTISIGIIASTLLMANQMGYVSNMSLGFDKENKLLVPLRGADVIESLPALRNELSTNPGILSVASAQNVPGGIMGLVGLNMETNAGSMELQSVSAMAAGEGFLQTMGIELVAGRDFSQRLLTDVGQNFVVNRTLVDRMGWDQPLGKRIDSAGPGLNGRVIGVVEDFHFASAHQPIAPLVILSTPAGFPDQNAQQRALQTRTLILNVAGDGIADTLDFVREVMLDFDPLHPFEFEFLDRRMAELYVSEQRVTRLTAVFAGICIFISCLGLFGLASFTTERRTKEIGIRKVLGASSLQIITLLSRNIILLVMIGAVVASIVSFVIVNQWLAGFAYRTGINPLIFLLAAMVAITVAFVTVALQSYKTVSANPVLALRHE